MNRFFTSGLSQAFMAYCFWGLVPLYWMWLAHVPAKEIMAHRIVWSFIILFGIAVMRKHLHHAYRVLRDKKTIGILLLTAILVSFNWFIYIWAVTNGYVIEASLGYYINPVVSMLLGVVFLSERLRRYQYLATFFAVLGVLILTINYGRLPWVALSLAISFAFYVFLRKFVTLDSQTALLIETGLIVIPALLYVLFGAHSHAILHDTWGHKILLIGGGAVTIIPLILLANGLKTLRLSTIGFLQYVGPTIQFLCGIFIFKEPFSTVQAISFALIWIGLAIYTSEAIVVHRQKKLNARA